MNKLYIWLSGLFTTCAVTHLLRVLMKVRIDINLVRLPLKVSAIVGLVGLILAAVFYLLGSKKAKQL